MGRGNLRLPSLGSQYAKPPKVPGGAIEKTRFRQIMENYYAARMCGICGTVHAPGEPHKSRNASTYNPKTGNSKLKVPSFLGDRLINTETSSERVPLKYPSVSNRFHSGRASGRSLGIRSHND